MAVGPASTLLAHAIAMTRDAVAGHWSGQQTRPTAAATEDYVSLSYLSEERRSQIRYQELASRFRVEQVRGGAKAMVGNERIFRSLTPDNAVLATQLKWLRAYADLRNDRNAEIVAQSGEISSFFGVLGHINPWRRGNTMTVMSLAQSLVIDIEMQVKHFCQAPRPVEFAPEVMPVIATPDHSTFPSGHSTEAFALATLLYRLMTGGSAAQGLAEMATPFRIAHRIAVNRTIAGVHFPIDSAAGAAFGAAMAEAIAALGEGSEPVKATFDPTGATGVSLAANEDFTTAWLRSSLAPALAARGEEKLEKPFHFASLWAAAKAEWGQS